MALLGRKPGAYAGVACPHCGQALDHANLLSGMQRCPACGRSFEAMRFAPPERMGRAQALAESPDQAAACANHPGNTAAGHCQRCGIFMCTLCRIEADETVLCPACFDRLSAEGALASTRTTFRDYSRLASTMAAAGIVMWVFAFLFGPFAVYYGVRSLGQMRRMGENLGRARAVVAIVLGTLETGGGVWMVSLMFRR